MAKARLSYINVTEKGNFVGYINVEAEPRKIGNMIVPVEELYFIRLASDDESQKGEIEDFNLDDWNVQVSTNDEGETFKWLRVKA